MESNSNLSHWLTREGTTQVLQMDSVLVVTILQRPSSKTRSWFFGAQKTSLRSYYCYKVLNGLSAINAENHFSIHNTVASSRSSIPYLQKPVKCSSKVSSSFFYRQVDAWNSLPSLLRNCSSLLTFKRDLNQVDLSTFLKEIGRASCRERVSQ